MSTPTDASESARFDGEGEALPDNVSPIRQQMMFVFDTNTPIVEPAVQERVDYRRYDSGLCRVCDAKRGEFTPWCRDHYPWRKDEWVDKGRGWTRDDLEGME